MLLFCGAQLECQRVRELRGSSFDFALDSDLDLETFSSQTCSLSIKWVESCFSCLFREFFCGSN